MGNRKVRRDRIIGDRIVRGEGMIGDRVVRVGIMTVERIGRGDKVIGCRIQPYTCLYTSRGLFQV